MKQQQVAVDIPVHAGVPLTGNVLPLLNELRHALEQLMLTGEERVIDLRSLPMAPGEEQHIEIVLGDGEVHARIDALGKSEVIETAVPGIWRLTHWNNEDQIVGKYIEVTHCPTILSSQAEDMDAGMERLKALIAEIHPEADA